MKNIINLCAVLLFSSFLQLYAQDTIGTDVGSVDTIPVNADKIKLKVDFTPSTMYHFTLSLSQKISQELMGSPIEATKTVKYTATSEIVRSDENGTTIKAIYEEIAVDIDMPQGHFTFNSGQDTTSSVITSIVNRPFLIYLDEEGKIEKEEGLDDIIEETQAIDQPAALALAGLELFNEYRIAKIIASNFTVLPDHPLEIGENWQKNSQQRINDQFNLDNTTTYTLESLNEDLAWINLEGVVSSSMGGENSLGEVNMEGTQSGTIEVERSTGLILSNDTHQEVEGLMKAQGFEVPIKIITDSSMTGEKL